MNAKLQYAIVELQTLSEDLSLSAANKKRQLGNFLKEEEKPYLIVALDLVPTLEAKWSVKLIIRKTLSGSDIDNSR